MKNKIPLLSVISFIVFISCSETNTNSSIKLICQAERAHFMKTLDGLIVDKWWDRDFLEQINEPYKDTKTSLPLEAFTIEVDKDEKSLFKLDGILSIGVYQNENGVGWIILQERDGLKNSLNYYSVNFNKRNFKIEISKPIDQSIDIFEYGFSSKLEIYGTFYGDCN